MTEQWEKNSPPLDGVDNTLKLSSDQPDWQVQAALDAYPVKMTDARLQMVELEALFRALEKAFLNLNGAQDVPVITDNLELPANIPQLPHVWPELYESMVSETGRSGDQVRPGDLHNGRGRKEHHTAGRPKADSPYLSDETKTAGRDWSPNNSVDKVIQLVSFNEGKPTSINWNDNGAGVSIGVFQANQKVGELPMSFAAMANNPAGYEELAQIFGSELAAQIKSNPDIVRKLDFKKDNELGHELEQLVHSPHFQEVQLKMLHQKIAHAANIAHKHGIESTAGVALVANIINQFGETGSAKFIAAADKVQGQESKARAVVEAVREHSHYGSKYKEDMQRLASTGLNFEDRFS